MDIIRELPPQLPPNTKVALDTEWFSMNENQLHRPLSGKFACLTIATEPDKVHFIDDPDKVAPALDILDNCVWVAHNSSFDITQLRRLANIPPRKRLWDTMLIDRILWSGYYDNFALDDLARRELDIEMDKSYQKTFYKSTEMSPEQIEYACKDSSVTLQVALAQKKYMTANDFKIWTEIDCPVMWAILDFQGFAINVDQWRVVAQNNKQRQADIDAQLPFNPRSHVQVKAWFAKHKITLESSDEEHLQGVINKNKSDETTKVAQMILDSRMYGKRASTYGEKFITDFLEYDDRVPVVVANYDPSGAETGRMAARNPHMQTIPSRETKEFRDCFIARPGHKLIIGDYSSQEPMITAYLSQDEEMIAIFRDGLDIYIEMALEIFNERINKKDDRRKQMKSVILGATYGLSKYGLAKRENIPVDLADEYLRKFFGKFRGVERWVERQQKKRNYVETVLGRKLYINSYTDQAKRNVLNAPVQGTAAEMMKKTVIVLHQTWNTEFPGIKFGVCGAFHDELVLDVPEEVAPKARNHVQAVMETVGMGMCPGLLFKAEVVIADKWSEK